MPTESSHCTLVPTLTETPPRNEFQVTLVPMAPAHYRKMLPPMFANYDGDQKPSKFQRKQWKPTSENHFLLAFVIPLLTADLPVWRPRVSDPAGRSHIHCRFPSKKCVLCRSCCCPGWRRRERHYVMTKNNCLSLGFLTASLLCLSILEDLHLQFVTLLSYCGHLHKVVFFFFAISNIHDYK